MSSDAVPEVADAAVERACQAIYREFDGYWPSDLERARIRVALGTTVEVDWQAENERLRALCVAHDVDPEGCLDCFMAGVEGRAPRPHGLHRDRGKADAATVTELVWEHGCFWILWRAVAAFPEIARRVWFDDKEADRG